MLTTAVVGYVTNDNRNILFIQNSQIKDLLNEQRISIGMHSSNTISSHASLLSLTPDDTSLCQSPCNKKYNIPLLFHLCGKRIWKNLCPSDV